MNALILPNQLNLLISGKYYNFRYSDQGKVLQLSRSQEKQNVSCYNHSGQGIDPVVVYIDSQRVQGRLLELIDDPYLINRLLLSRQDH